MFFADIFGAKVIDHEGELNRLPVVGPQPRDQWALTVSVGVEAFFEEFVGEETRLWKSVHAKADEDIDGPIRFGEVL